VKFLENSSIARCDVGREFFPMDLTRRENELCGEYVCINYCGDELYFNIICYVPHGMCVCDMFYSKRPFLTDTPNSGHMPYNGQ